VRYAVDGWGTGELVFAGEVLVWHESPRPPAVSDDDHPLAERVRRYLSGERETFVDVELDLDWCSPFQRAAVEALRAVPYGETVTYGELAALAGHPNAQRAAGSVCATNRYGLFVPCHRVVGVSGLGSYGSLGLDYKRRLLELEGVLL